METVEKIDHVNALIVINHDRHIGYKKAAEDIKDDDLKKMFLHFSEQSDRFAEELRRFVPTPKEPEPDETKITGKLHRLWMDIKAAITQDERKVVLSSCEFGEDHALQTYNDALKHTDELPLGAWDVITKQKAEIQKSHDWVKQLRDEEKGKQ